MSQILRFLWQLEGRITFLLFVHWWQYGGGCFITNFVPQVTKEVTWLSSWKSLAVEETDISDFCVKHLLLWDELSPGHSLAWLAHPMCWGARFVQTAG